MSTRQPLQHPLEYPEIKHLFSEMLPVLISESDRGAVLVGTSIVDDHLTQLFRGIAPTELSNKRCKELLKYPGPLSSFSAKVEIAYLTRLIERGLYDAINAFRKIRNKVAHEPSSFSLHNQADQVRDIYDKVGDGMSTAINRIALDFMLQSMVNNALRIRLPDSEEPAFGSPQEAFDFISESDELINQMDGRLPRYELAVAVLLICALLFSRREEARRALGSEGNKILSNLVAASLTTRRDNEGHEDETPKETRT